MKTNSQSFSKCYLFTRSVDLIFVTLQVLSVVVDELPILDDVMLHTAPSVIVMVMALMVSAIMHGSHCSHIFL